MTDPTSLTLPLKLLILNVQLLDYPLVLLLLVFCELLIDLSTVASFGVSEGPVVPVGASAPVSALDIVSNNSQIGTLPVGVPP